PCCRSALACRRACASWCGSMVAAKERRARSASPIPEDAYPKKCERPRTNGARTSGVTSPLAVVYQAMQPCGQPIADSDNGQMVNKFLNNFMTPWLLLEFI